MMPAGGGAGGGSYEISPAHSNASAQAANQAAGVVINFGQGSTLHGGYYDQTAKPTATATASRGPATSNVAADGGDDGGPGGTNWLLIGSIAGAALLITAVILLKK